MDHHPKHQTCGISRLTLTFAQPIPVRDQLVRGTSLSIVADPAIEGTFMGELKHVTVRQALGLSLPPIGLDYRIEGAFIRVGQARAAWPPSSRRASSSSSC